MNIYRLLYMLLWSCDSNLVVLSSVETLPAGGPQSADFTPPKGTSSSSKRHASDSIFDSPKIKVYVLIICCIFSCTFLHVVKMVLLSALCGWVMSTQSVSPRVKLLSCLASKTTTTTTPVGVLHNMDAMTVITLGMLWHTSSWHVWLYDTACSKLLLLLLTRGGLTLSLEPQVLYRSHVLMVI